MLLVVPVSISREPHLVEQTALRRANAVGCFLVLVAHALFGVARIFRGSARLLSLLADPFISLCAPLLTASVNHRLGFYAWRRLKCELGNGFTTLTLSILPGTRLAFQPQRLDLDFARTGFENTLWHPFIYALKMQLSFLAALCGAAVTYAIPTIEALGNKFFTSEGNQFFIKGTNSQYNTSIYKH